MDTVLSHYHFISHLEFDENGRNMIKEEFHHHQDNLVCVCVSAIVYFRKRSENYPLGWRGPVPGSAL